MSAVITTVFDEIQTAHGEALKALEDLADDKASHDAFLKLYRLMETWELDLLTSQIGEGIDLTTFNRLSGAFGVITMMKTLMNQLAATPPAAKQGSPERARRFTEALLSSKSKPV